jgi:magnesium transporter
MSVTPQEITRIGPQGRSRVWLADRTLASNVDPDSIIELLQRDTDIRAWWCLPRDAASMHRTAEFLQLDAFAVQDVVGLREAPKVDAVGDTVIVVSAAVSFDPVDAAVAVERVSVLATDRVLVVVADDRQLSVLAPLLDLCAGRMRDDGIGAGLHIVLEALVDGYGQVVEAMEDATDALTSTLFDDKPMGKAEQLRAFRLRQAIATLRKVVSPMTAVTATLAGAAGRPTTEQDADPVAALLTPAIARRFADVADHARHAADSTTGLREMLTSAFETNLALADVHLNTIMKKLSAWAAIIAVPTLITGFMGMNVPYPGFGQGQGFLVGLAVMIAAVVTLFVLFRRSDWL